jgi:HlyD family secretion protein
MPVSGLFRKGDQWAVFADENSRAKTVPVSIRHRNNRVAGLSCSEGNSMFSLGGSDRVTHKSKPCWRQIFVSSRLLPG